MNADERGYKPHEIEPQMDANGRESNLVCVVFTLQFLVWIFACIGVHLRPIWLGGLIGVDRRPSAATPPG
jgi:hypothetical protein